MQGNKGKADLNNSQNIKGWKGNWPQIVGDTLRVEINEVFYYPKLISSVRCDEVSELSGIDIMLIVFKMGKDVFQGNAYDFGDPAG